VARRYPRSPHTAGTGAQHKQIKVKLAHIFSNSPIADITGFILRVISNVIEVDQAQH
jgi:hypothetical protein